MGTRTHSLRPLHSHRQARRKVNLRHGENSYYYSPNTTTPSLRRFGRVVLLLLSRGAENSGSTLYEGVFLLCFPAHHGLTCGQTYGRSLPGSAIDPISNSDQNLVGGTRTPRTEIQSPPSAHRMMGDLVSSKEPRPRRLTPSPTLPNNLQGVLKIRRSRA